jgi:uncharacterized protein YbcC (UPF0753/DUF2309 family)
VSTTIVSDPPATFDDAGEVLRAACRRIAPLWPLERFVAVNPYLGLADQRFAEAAEFLAATAGAHTTMPVAYYLDAVDDGRIGTDDLAVSLTRQGADPHDVDSFLRAARADGERGDIDAASARVPTVADVASSLTGEDWVHLCTERVSAWAAAYFDAGQAMWRSAARDEALFAAWKAEAAVDRTPEVMGLRGFRAIVRALPDDPVAAADQALRELALPAGVLEPYLHRLLLRVGGWAAYAARIVFEEDLRGREDDTLVQLLAVLLSWELAVLQAPTRDDVGSAWAQAKEELRAWADDRRVRPSLERRLVLQEAFDRAEQRRLAAAIDTPASASPVDAARPGAQAVFCIDVRSEVLRRHLEAVAPDVETIGFAGFFGIPIEYVPIAHREGVAQCPVLLTPGQTVAETVGDPVRQEEAVEARRLAHHVRRAWKSFKMGAVSCFSFVGPVGLAYLPKLFTDGHGWTRPVRRPETESLPAWAAGHRGPQVVPRAPTSELGIPLADRVELASGALRAMSLADGFAPLVLITGHGATTVNNPYDAALDCGACGGRAGEPNARVAATILNDGEVRAALVERGIVIPPDTWFLAGQHDTTVDGVTLFDADAVPTTHRAALAELEARLAEAGRRARAERAPRLGISEAESIDDAVARRSADWSQVRPEWGLAGCRAFVVAPRRRTRRVDLGGRAFLHSYEWRRDEGFGVLELIMTAPMVVASWISLQYYASTVDNRVFGSGSKTLHNVVGRVGVLEGNGGDLRVGLPWQSVHDGESLQHEPLRLNVVIEAPLEAMNDVIARHDHVRELCDNGWVHLLAMDDDGRVSHRYAGDLRWEPMAP